MRIDFAAESVGRDPKQRPPGQVRAGSDVGATSRTKHDDDQYPWLRQLQIKLIRPRRGGPLGNMRFLEEDVDVPKHH